MRKNMSVAQNHVFNRSVNWMFSDSARWFRFACTGGLGAVVQLILLKIMTAYGWNPILANAIAFLVSAQVNFLFNSLFTWGDRRAHASFNVWFRRWLTFHSTIAGTAILNMLIFTIAHLFVPTLIASVLGIVCASFINFMSMNKLVFKHGAEGVLPLETEESIMEMEEVQI